MNSKASPKKRRLNAWAEGQPVDQSEGPRSVAVRGTVGAGCQRLSHATRLQGAWLLGRHRSDPPLLLPNCFSSSHCPSLCPRAGVRHSGAALLFQEVRFPTLPSHGATGVPHSAQTSQETNLLSPDRFLPGTPPFYPGQTAAAPDPSPPATRAVKAGTAHGARARHRPSPAGRATGPPLPGCAPPSPALPARHGGGGATRRDGRLSAAAPAPASPGGQQKPRPGPAAARAPWAWAGAAAPGDSGQPPPGPAHTFPIKGKTY